jgi:hypothetical protein
MLNINFDLLYELKQGSIISNTDKNVVKYWRVVDSNLETRMVINNDAQDDWYVTDLFVFPVDGKFTIEQRFERFSNG